MVSFPLLVAVGTGKPASGLQAHRDRHQPADGRKGAHESPPRWWQTSGSCSQTRRNWRFANETFDAVLTVCTFCSVPNPVDALQELYRVLKPRGRLLMYEHVRSKLGPFTLFLYFMTFLTRTFGPDLHRDMVGNVLQTGFTCNRKRMSIWIL